MKFLCLFTKPPTPIDAQDDDSWVDSDIYEEDPESADEVEAESAQSAAEQFALQDYMEHGIPDAPVDFVLVTPATGPPKWTLYRVEIKISSTARAI